MGCGPSGLVDRAQNLETGERIALERAVASPATAPGLLVAPGLPSWVWRLPEGVPERSTPVPATLRAPPVSDGRRVVLATDVGLEWLALGGRERHLLPVEPAPWYPPALTGPWIAWVSIANGRERIGLDRDGERRWIASGDHPRHPAAQGGWLAWISDRGVHLLELESGYREVIPTDAHTARSLSLWGGVACWEAWNGVDVDVRCSDGVAIGVFLLLVSGLHPHSSSRLGPASAGSWRPGNHLPTDSPGQ